MNDLHVRSYELILFETINIYSLKLMVTGARGKHGARALSHVVVAKSHVWERVQTLNLLMEENNVSVTRLRQELAGNHV
jgi:hypothetical protein